jgi:hypothetical protein
MVMYIASHDARPQRTTLSDPNGGSYGLTQINGFWCLPNSNWPIGWLQEKGILEECSDLFNATICTARHPCDIQQFRMVTMGNSEVNDMYPETGITESTRKMFEFIDDMFTPNYLKKERASHLYHLVGELEALRDDLRRMDDPRANFLQLAITELSQLII